MNHTNPLLGIPKLTQHKKYAKVVLAAASATGILIRLQQDSTVDRRGEAFLGDTIKRGRPKNA
jgi:hypothetical protein